MHVLVWQVKSPGIRQSKIIKGTVMAGLEEKGLRKRVEQVGPCPNIVCVLQIP